MTDTKPNRVVINRVVIESRHLRYLLVAELMRCQLPVSPRELVERIEARGLTVPGRAPKTVSDALRWEVAKGRVVKLGRGRYAGGNNPQVDEILDSQSRRCLLSRK